MLIRLDVPFADVRAVDLTLVLGAAREPALEVLCADGVELRLLGGSHQAIVGGVSETVACRPGRSDPLPARTRSGDYTFRAGVDRLAPAAYAARARELIAAVAGDERGLVGVFPGPADAFTALRAADGPTWESWHGYPQTGEIVHTRSALERR